MRKRNLTIWLMVVVGICVLGLPKAEAAIDIEKHSLKGLEGVDVLVEYLSPDAKQIGLTRKQIQTDVELRLRRNNINVSSEFSPCHLYVRMSVMKVKGMPIFVYCVEVGFEQTVMLVRDPEKRCIATTWSTMALGCVGELRGNNAIRQVLKDKVDEFVNDYLAVNQE